MMDELIYHVYAIKGDMAPRKLMATFREYHPALNFAVNHHGQHHKDTTVQLRDVDRDCTVNTLFRDPPKKD